MAKARIITYECVHCGNEIVVTSTGEGQLSPIYCCGIEVTEVSTAGKKPASKKKTVKKPAKKAAKKKVAAKKKPAARKKASKK